MTSRARKMLRDDADALRCWREVVTREDPLTLDGVLACYGTRQDRLSSADVARELGVPFEENQARAFSEGDSVSDDALLAQLRERLGVKTSTSDGDSERVAKPRFADPSDERWDRYLRAGLGLTRNELAAEAPTANRDGTTSFGPPPDELIAVPESLASSIERTYEELASRGALPEEEFERRAYEWLSRESGA